MKIKDSDISWKLEIVNDLMIKLSPERMLQIGGSYGKIDIYKVSSECPYSHSEQIFNSLTKQETYLILCGMINVLQTVKKSQEAKNENG